MITAERFSEVPDSFEWNARGYCVSIAAKITNNLPGVFKTRVRVECESDAEMKIIPTNEQLQSLILFYAHQLLEKWGHDRYGLISFTRRFHVYVGNDESVEQNPIYSRQYSSVWACWQAVYSGSHISYKTLLKAEKILDEKERSICDELYAILKRDFPDEMVIYAPVSRYTRRQQSRQPDGKITGFWVGPDLKWFNNKKTYINAITKNHTNRQQHSCAD
jgi:hypothetical protein